MRSFLTATRRRWLSGGLAAIYALGAIVHLYFTLTGPEVYERFGDLALLSVYRDLWTAFVVPNLRVLLPVVILFEAGVAWALVSRRFAHMGNVGGATFQLALVPTGPWGPINVLLAGVHAALLGLPDWESSGTEQSGPATRADNEES